MQETWVRSLGWEDPLEKEMAHHWKVSELKPSNASEDCSIISDTPLPWGVHYLWRKSQQLGRMYVLEDGEGEWGLFWSQRRMNRKKITSTLSPTHTHTHTHTHTLYLLFRFFPVELFSTSLSPPSATPAGRNFMYTNEEILNKGIGSRRRH